MRLQEPLKSTLPILMTIKCENLAPGPCSYKNITFYPEEEDNIFEIQCLNIASFDENAFRRGMLRMMVQQGLEWAEIDHAMAAE